MTTPNTQTSAAHTPTPRLMLEGQSIFWLIPNRGPLSDRMPELNLFSLTVCADNQIHNGTSDKDAKNKAAEIFAAINQHATPTAISVTAAPTDPKPQATAP